MEAKPTSIEIAEATHTLERINMPRHGFLTRHPRLLILLHSGPLTPSELNELGSNFVGLTRGKTEAQKREILAKLDIVFERAYKKSRGQDSRAALAHLLQYTASQTALDRASNSNVLRALRTTGRSLLKAARFPRRALAAVATKVKPPDVEFEAPFIDVPATPPRQKVNKAKAVLHRIGMPRYGWLSGHPHIMVKLADAAQTKALGFDVEKQVKKLGQRFADLSSHQKKGEAAKAAVIKLLAQTEAQAHRLTHMEILDRLLLATSSHLKLKLAISPTLRERAAKGLLATRRFLSRSVKLPRFHKK